MAGQRANLASLVEDFERHGKDLAIVSPRGVRRRKIRYSELALLARRFAAELQSRGIVKGDRVLLWGENGAEWVASFFGCVLRGVLPVPVDFASASDFARRVENEVSPKLLVGDADKLASLPTSTPRLFFAGFNSALAAQTARAIEDLSGEDALQIVFTSGTTGEPKGIVHTHLNVLASLGPIESEAQRYLKYERLVHPVRFLHTLPLSHVFGQFMGLWIPPIIAAELHYEPRLVAAEIVDRIRAERISVLASVPRMLDLLQSYVLERIPDLRTRVNKAGRMKALARWWHFRDVHRLFGFKFWAFVCGGASLSPQGEQFWTSLGFVVVQGYGMTETTALVSLNHPFRPAQGAIGQVLPGREVRLSDEGEVLVRGDTISNTTWRQGRPEKREADWLATGDLAEFDPQGNLRFRGRKKEVIVTSSGLNIYPEDLEAALSRQPGVKAGAVLENDTGHGPEPLGVLVMTGGANAETAVQAANRELAEFQQIRRWLLWPEPDFPRTSTGKVLRREIARRIAGGEVEAAPDGVASQLDLDSLGRVQLQARLEQQYGVKLDDAALQQAQTQEDVRELIIRAGTGPPREREPGIQHIYPRWPWNPVIHALRVAFLELAAFPLVRLLARPGIERRVDDWPTGPLLLVANHVTSYDVPLILYSLPRRLRDRVAIAMSGEMILDYRAMRNQDNWFLNLLAPVAYVLITGLFNVFPLPQLSGFRRSFYHAGEAADRGYSVLIFPEGRRADNEAPQPFKPGAGLLWKELGTPALPVRIRGLGELKATRGRWLRSGRITISPRAAIPLDASQTPEQLTIVLWHAVFDD
ncbi:MAG: AMP-binding protein [Acidobacteriaceae bacterium]|nr:AMP-binding protein [Acidobacteriaceae bacterium]